MICGPTGRPVVILESLISMNVGGGGTTERRIRTSQLDDESVRCRGSKVRGHVLVQSKRDKRSALKLMRKLLKKMRFVPDKLVTDDLRPYGAAARDLGISHRHERGRWRNNRAENSHQPTRRRERKMQGFKSGTGYRCTRPRWSRDGLAALKRLWLSRCWQGSASPPAEQPSHHQGRRPINTGLSWPKSA
jgi:hypothetical protein